jgi:hypothetical protein
MSQLPLPRCFHIDSPDWWNIPHSDGLSSRYFSYDFLLMSVKDTTFFVLLKGTSCWTQKIKTNVVYFANKIILLQYKYVSSG